MGQCTCFAGLLFAFVAGCSTSSLDAPQPLQGDTSSDVAPSPSAPAQAVEPTAAQPAHTFDRAEAVSRCERTIDEMCNLEPNSWPVAFRCLRDDGIGPAGSCVHTMNSPSHAYWCCAK